jgi:uncharacterized protein (TIGR02246 family)
MKYALSICLSVICFAAHAADPETTAIQSMIDMQQDAWNRGDIAAFVRPYDDTGKMIFITSEEPVRSPGVLKERYEKRYATGAKDFGKLNFSDVTIELLSDSIARVYGKWHVTQKEKTSSGWFTLLLQKRDNEWRIIHDHSS